MSASPDRRSTATSTTYTAIALVFFFGLGLAGGTAYKLWFAEDYSDQQTADAVDPSALPDLPQTAPQTAQAAPTEAPAFAQPLAHLTPSAPPALAPPPAATAFPPNILMTPAAPAASAPAQADPAPYAQVAPSSAPDLATASPPPPVPPRTLAQRHAPPPRKPHMIAKAKPAAPPPAEPSIALHEPPSAPANLTGPFRVQFGAFANEENARRMQWAVEATGLKVQVTQAPGNTNGQMLYYLRSPIYHDYASALSAAQTVQDRVQHFVNAIPVDYAIIGDHSGDHAAIEQQAQR